jgi:ketosteroid isomerase-like protein
MPKTTTPLDIVEAYHQAWTRGDVDRALTYLADSVVCSAPDAAIKTKAQWREYLSGFVPRLTGAPELTRMTDGDRVALWYFPQTATTETTLASELFTVDGEQITDIRLCFDRLSYMPPQVA